MNASVQRGALYPAALMLVTVVQAWILYIFNRFIIAGDGVGVSAVFLYLSALVFSPLLWAASYYYQRDRTKAVIFWATALAMMPVILTQQVWWSAPEIGN